ncbi:RIIa domain-containing protein 1-like isoform X1 [Erpetoichthys calabaricus]|uniref:RIIa domain-containing protein 1-like isoform X1 n=1 Tax=Erpetoichthys calabaricus TaxID=27687 RepID=UPI002234AD2A|nr:RIIa domain-containing protein 1-like isoform X1 [Erpetoichthys calabaricus]
MDPKSAMEQLDIGALNSAQQEQLEHFKIKTRISNENYLRSHPEVELLLGEFLREVFLKRPVDIREFAAALLLHKMKGFQLCFDSYRSLLLFYYH